MITIGHIYKRFVLLLIIVILGISIADGQTLKDYAKNYKEELAEKQKLEKEAYEKACYKGTIDALLYFVNNFPKSKYANDAKSKIRNIELKKEKNTYDAACQTGTLEAFRGFLNQYPKSQYAEDIQNRIKDLDQWNEAKRNNTILAYESYLQKSKFRTFEKEAKVAIEDIKAVAEWQTVKSTNSLSDVQEYIKKYPNVSSITDARKKEHELKGVQYYKNGNLAAAYREFNNAGGRYAITFTNRTAYDECKEYNEFSLLNSYSKETDLFGFLTKYPNSPYRNQVSNLIAIAKAKELTMYSGDYSYKNALSYAKDEATRNQVKEYYEARKREYSEYKKQQRRIKRYRDGGIINIGVEPLDIGFNPSAEEEYDSDIEYDMYYNLGLAIKIGNYKSPIQFEVGAKPGVVIYSIWYGSDYETKAKFHLPLYARLKIGLIGGSSSKWYIDGIGYYNAIKESYLEGDYSISAGLGVSWRHWDWRILYYKQDISPEETYSDYKFIGSSFSYYF